jgi:hypothetical protein
LTFDIAGGFRHLVHLSPKPPDTDHENGPAYNKKTQQPGEKNSAHNDRNRESYTPDKQRDDAPYKATLLLPITGQIDIPDS